MSDREIQELERKCRSVWKRTLRMHGCLPEIRIASSLSCVELLSVLFYGGWLRLFPGDPGAAERDRIIPSKGHGSVCLYPILADLGFFSPDLLEHPGTEGNPLTAIPSAGVGVFETVNGSLGHGPGVGCGRAVGLRTRGNPARVIVLAGDGELSEGAVWEAVMFAGHHHLDHLYLLIDANRKSMLGKCCDIMNCDHLAERFSAFGWQVFSCNGHDVAALADSFSQMFASTERKPRVLIADTVKGHGVPELEQNDICHVLSLSPERIEELTGGAE